jgi:hypothetical protein
MTDDQGGDELTAHVTYRVAFGEAYRIAESRERSFAANRDRVRDVRLVELDLARNIARRLGVDPEAIQDAVTDALAGRRPRW